MRWIALVVCCGLGVGHAESVDVPATGRQVEPGVLNIGQIENPRLTESSGVVVSRKDPGVFWTHSDGRRNVLYAMTRHGKHITDFRISGVALSDWEDIAADGNGHLYVADTGNNDGKRSTVAVYQIDEPETQGNAGMFVNVKRSWMLQYPGAPFDSEALFMVGDHGYLISKVSNDQRAAIYRFSLKSDAATQTLELVGETRIDSPVTGADVSADGRLLGIVAKNGAYLYTINGDVARATRGKPFQNKFKHDSIEAATFVPEGLLATAESREIFLFTDAPFRGGAVPKKK